MATEGGINMKGTSVKKAELILRHQLNMIWAMPENAGVVPPLMIWGPPGIGKSTFIRNLCEELDIGFIDIRLAQREPVDIRGLPVPRDDGEGIDWIISSEWPRAGQEGVPEKGIILFDELTAADSTLQVAAYEFILDRRLGQLYKVPDGWYIVAAGNRSSDGAVARTMSSALANRFCHLELRADSKSWLDWALVNNIDHRVTGFIRYMPQRIFSMKGNKERGWPSPRSWERVAMELKMAQINDLDSDLLNIIVEGLIGEAAAIEFIGYLQWSEKIPDVSKMLTGEIKAEVPTRPDQRYAMVSAIVHNLRQSEHPENLLDGLFDILLKFPNDWIQLVHHDLTLAMDSDGNDEFLIAFFDHPRHQELEGKILL
ncbi:MAG TPA: AAA family ATPase [Candidatus Poseidoniales archaeon]|jgi:DNA polymerase III delta prime subunit|nr:MAG: hypothetical protein CXT71_07820 [Euryarchaeota archaeon]HIF45960.1 AAA family ATPase [Candidatus Poseidoniales archaeon]HIL65322.1 AAA family ATPase [Candidatus Poseidoniales archaeon]